MLVIIINLMALMLIFQSIFYYYYIQPKQSKILHDLYAENFIGINRAWIDIWEGNINITAQDIYKVEVMLNEMEKGLKNG